MNLKTIYFPNYENCEDLTKLPVSKGLVPHGKLERGVGEEYKNRNEGAGSVHFVALTTETKLRSSTFTQSIVTARSLPWSTLLDLAEA